jgi:acyl-coenzyme A thioesterase PaaI-like protein
VTPDLVTLRAFFASAPFMADLGIEPFEAAEGRIATRIALAPRHLQHTGVVHAGVIGAMADHTMGAAAQTMAPPVTGSSLPSSRSTCCARAAAIGSSASGR